MKTRTIFLILASLALAACASSARRLAAQREKDPQYQYEKAVVCMNYGLHDDALKYLDQALVLNSRHFLSHNLRGLAMMMKGNLPEALSSFQRCVEVAPNFSEGHNNWGTALEEDGKTERAEAEYLRAAAIDGNANACYNLAKLYFRQEKFELALDAVRRSLQKNNRSVLAFNLQGLILQALKKMDDAVVSFEAALRLVPDEVNVRFNLAAAFYALEEYAKARDTLARARKDLQTRPAQPQDAELRRRIEDLARRLEGR